LNCLFSTMNLRKLQILTVILTILYFVVILILLTKPISIGSGMKFYFLGIRSDKYAHALLFFPFSILMFHLHEFFERKYSALKLYFLGIMLCAICESMHYFIPYRSFDFFDFVANCVGLSIGSFIYIWKPNVFNLYRIKTN
jgi:Na+/melibiose symporter-like transporter